MQSCIFVIDHDLSGFDDDLPGFADRILGIDGQIEDDLIKLGAVGVDCGSL